ncbi:MAG: lysine--tRNA ligase [Thermoplasmata archaeon]
MRAAKELEFDENKIASAERLKERGYVLYPHYFEKKETVESLLKRFADATHEKNPELIATAGRLFIKRLHGKVIFADLKDITGKIQLYVRKDEVGDEQFLLFKDELFPGDIIGVSGNIFRTKMGEISIWVKEIKLLAKSLCPLPEKFHGLRNIEKRYRQRYVDLMVNEEAVKTFQIRSKTISALRHFLEQKGYLEFETPILQPVYGGANARPFTTHHHFLDRKLYLRIAPELYLKRLVVGGFEKVYEIARNFRNEDIDTTHNPEFTMVEIYEAYSDFEGMMQLTEELISALVKEISGKDELCIDGKIISLRRPFERMTMEEAVKKYTGLEVLSMDMDSLRKFALENKIDEYDKPRNQREMLVVLFEWLVEDKLVQPVFIYDYPVEVSPLAKKHRKKEGFTERFELFINGWELGNGFSELNDPLDQKQRFEEQDRKRVAGDVEAQMIDYDYVNALGYGMPPAGGLGIGIDRLVMLLTGNVSIKEVLLFPQMKTQQTESSSSDTKNTEDSTADNEKEGQ